MLRYLLIVLSIASATTAKSQGHLIIQGPDSLMHEGLLWEAIAAYKDSIVASDRNPYYVYNLGCAYAIAGMADSSVKYLKQSQEHDSESFYSVLTDPDLVSIKDHKDWKGIEDAAIVSLQAKTKKPIKDLEYARILWRMRALDQAHYADLRLLERKIGRGSTVARTVWKQKNTINDQNQKELEALVEKRGWPKISEVGHSAADAAFLVIQHADHDKQKKYLPVIEALCKQNEADWESYALMYDRVQTSENKPQKFGSQIKYNSETKKHELFPLLDAAKVDEWRKEMGMRPLADYVKKWGIEFKAPEK